MKNCYTWAMAFAVALVLITTFARPALAAADIESTPCISNVAAPNPWPWPSAYDGGRIALGTFGQKTVFTLSFWIKPDPIQNGYSVILDCSHGGSNNWVIQSLNGGTTWIFNTVTFQLTPGNWQHVLITYDNGLTTVFVNGVQSVQANHAITYSGGTDLSLGNWAEGGRRFAGSIDELFITGSVLQTASFTPNARIGDEQIDATTMGLWHFDEGSGVTSVNSANAAAAQLGAWTWHSRTTLVTLPSFVSASGLMGWWPMNGDAQDWSGAKNHLTVVGNSAMTTARDGENSAAYYLDGVKDCLKSVDKFYNSSLDHTLSMWFQNIDVNRYGVLYNTDPHVIEGAGYNNGSNPAQSLGFHLGDGNAWSVGISAISTDFIKSAWTHLVVAKEGTTWKYYVNGQLKKTFVATTQTANTPADLVFGASTCCSTWPGFTQWPNEEFLGKMDDIGLWNRALSDAEVLALFESCDAPVPVITGVTQICRGTESTYQVAHHTGNVYNWTVSPNGTIVSGGSTHSVNVRWNDAGTGTLSVRETATSPANCFGDASISVTINTVPSPTITGTTNINLCALPQIVYSVVEESGNTYAWTDPLRGDIVGSLSQRTVTIEWKSVGADTVRMTQTNSSASCSTSALLALNISASSPQPPTIAGPSQVCRGTEVDYSVEAHEGNAYVWTISNKGSISSGGATNQVKVRWSYDGLGTLTVRETASSAATCFSEASVNVTINTTPSPTITGTTNINVCALRQIVYSVAAVSGNTYAWTDPYRGDIVGSSSQRTVTIEWKSTGADTVRMTQTNSSASCSKAASLAVYISNTGLPLNNACIRVTDDAVTCQGADAQGRRQYTVKFTFDKVKAGTNFIRIYEDGLQGETFTYPFASTRQVVTGKRTAADLTLPIVFNVDVYDVLANGKVEKCSLRHCMTILCGQSKEAAETNEPIAGEQPTVAAIMALAPNPASDVVEILLSIPYLDPSSSLDIIDMHGSIVATIATAMTRGDMIIPTHVSTLVNGMYMVRMLHAGGTLVVPLQVVR
ncbi:MAG: LamG-like jellyroll fold domain-containing protein [bacterium]|nr:LamG-like jellyroll fold domain-containing protein [bacterium]